MSKIRIKCLKQTVYKELVKKYENPLITPCTMSVGDVYYTDGYTKPENFCDSAWNTIKEFTIKLANGERGLFNNWMKNPNSLLLSCNDGFRPMSFLIEIIN